MSDNQDQNEEVHSMSEKFENISTSDSNLNNLIENDTSTSSSSPKPKSINLNKSINSSSTRRQKIEYSQTGIDLLKLNNPIKNLNEKIIFIIDTFKEIDSTQFLLTSEKKNYTALSMIKHSIELFYNAKTIINNNHEFAIMILNKNSCNWLLDFTNDKKKFLNCLENIEIINQDDNNQKLTFDISNIFQTVLSHVNFESRLKPPTQVIRAIMIYSRSICEPEFETGVTTFKQLMRQPLFYLDILYVHETPTKDNKCEDIYQALILLDAKSNSYIFEVGRNATHLHNHMAKLLAHPMQRPKQQDICYKVFEIIPIKNQTEDI